MSVALSPSWILYQITGGVASFLNPINDIVSYMLPKSGPYVNGSLKIETTENHSLNGIASLEDRKHVVNEINDLAKKAGLCRKVDVYASLKGTYSSFGGLLSFTRPIVQVPIQHLWRNENRGIFGNQQDETALAADTWRYTDHETRFLILRTMTNIKMNDSLLKILLRVIMISAVILLHLHPATWVISLAVLGTAFLIHFLVDRIFRERSDRQALNSLIKVSESQKEAYSVAINALKKQQQQNLYYRKQCGMAKLFINSRGDERFNFLSPSLSTRIRRLEGAASRVEREEVARPGS